MGTAFSDGDRKSTRLNSSHMSISYAVFCLKKKMAPTALAANHLVQERLDVVQQCVLPFVEEDSGGSVKGLQVNQPVADAALAHDLVDEVGSVDKMQALVRNTIDHPAEHPEPAFRVRWKSAFRDRLLFFFY